MTRAICISFSPSQPYMTVHHNGRPCLKANSHVPWIRVFSEYCALTTVNRDADSGSVQHCVDLHQGEPSLTFVLDIDVEIIGKQNEEFSCILDELDGCEDFQL